jgi:hypothetical protein
MVGLLMNFKRCPFLLFFFFSLSGDEREKMKLCWEAPFMNEEEYLNWWQKSKKKK